MRRALVTTLTALIVSAPLGLAVAPPAAAECLAIDGCIADGEKTGDPKPPPPTQPPRPEGCEATGTCPTPTDSVSQTWRESTRWGGAKYFWQTGTVPLTVPFAAQDYAGLYDLAGCGPQQGFPDAPYGTTYNLRAGFWVVDATEYHYVLRSENGQLDTIEGPTTRSYERQCTTFTTESPKTVELTQYGELHIQGPFQADGSAMLAAAQGGTLTRDSNKYGVESVQGRLINGASSLGKAVLKRLGTLDDLPALKTALPTAKEAYYNGLTGQDLSWHANDPEKLDDFGRYYAVSERYRPRVAVVRYEAYPQFVGEMFPSVVAQNGTQFFASNPAYPPMFVDSISGPAKVDDVQRFKILCTENLQPSETTTYSPAGFTYVAVGGPQAVSNAAALATATTMPSLVMNADWRDDARSYSFECGPPPNRETEVRGGDYLTCDTYDTTQTSTRDSVGVTYSTVQTGQSCRTVTDWCGYTVDGNGNINVWCATHQECSPTYGQVMNPGPTGWSRDGNVWREPCPTGWRTDSPTQCSSVTVGGKVVENRNAAPITDVDYKRLEDADVFAWPSNLSDSETATTGIGSFGDQLRVQWMRPRINVNTGPDRGKSVNDVVGGDVKWSRNWELADDSSPILTYGADKVTVEMKNDPNGAYHVFVDRTPDTTNDAPNASAKWEPVRDDGTRESVALSKWKGLEAAGWENSQRAALFRFFQSGTAGGPGWTMTPWWRATVTLPVEFDEITGVVVGDDGVIRPQTGRVTKNVRRSYDCPGQRINVDVTRTVN